MFDLGWTELLLIGVVALIVVGPKDLPGMFRTLGRFTGKMKNMAREFQRAMNDAADEAGVNDIAKDLKKATSAKSMGLDKLNAAADKFDAWEPGKGKTRGKPVDRGEKKAPDDAPKAEATKPELSPERAEVARKIQDATAKKATARLAAEAEVSVEPPAQAPKAAGDKTA